jgi:hypothetical protein
MKKNIYNFFSVTIVLSFLFGVIMYFRNKCLANKTIKYCNCPIKVINVKNPLEAFCDKNIYEFCKNIDSSLKKGDSILIKKEQNGFIIKIDSETIHVFNDKEMLYKFITLIYSDILKEFQGGYKKIIIQRPLFFPHLRYILLNDNNLILN